MREKFCSLLDFIQNNAGKIFTVCLVCIESAAITQSIHRENFRDSSNIRENHKAFLSHSFFCL